VRRVEQASNHGLLFGAAVEGPCQVEGMCACLLQQAAVVFVVEQRKCLCAWCMHAHAGQAAPAAKEVWVGALHRLPPARVCVSHGVHQGVDFLGTKGLGSGVECRRCRSQGAQV
jgi:hypothetical protein